MLKKNQNGMASMIIVMLIMTLLTLIVLSMVKNSNREQRQSLDRQLNSEAFQGAEGGIDGAEEFIKHPPAGFTPPIKKTDCDPISGVAPGEYFPGKSATIDAVNQISYSCVLYDSTPDSLEFSSVDVGKSELLPIKSVSGLIRSLTFSWVNPADDGPKTFAGCPAAIHFPISISNTCDAGVLRVELIDPSGIDRQDLIDKNFLAFLKPNNHPLGASTPNYAFTVAGGRSKQGIISRGQCFNGGECSLTISNINKPELLLHLRSIYKNNKVTITGTTSLGSRIEFENAQVIIDSTGRSNDVLKRIKVRKGLFGTFAEFGLQTTEPICKKLRITNTVEDGC